MNWHIRPAVLNDIEYLVGVDLVAQQDPRRREQITRAIASRECWVACDADESGTPVGYGCLDHSFFGEFFIPLVIVSSAFRRSGIGRRIMTHLEQVSTAQKVFTSTNTSNLPMRELLAQMGYQYSGTLEHLDPGDPEMVFVKFLR